VADAAAAGDQQDDDTVSHALKCGKSCKSIVRFEHHKSTRTTEGATQMNGTRALALPTRQRRTRGCVCQLVQEHKANSRRRRRRI
jgi:hypothetical protein